MWAVGLILSVLVREGLPGEVAALEQGGEGGSCTNNQGKRVFFLAGITGAKALGWECALCVYRVARRLM